MGIKRMYGVHSVTIALLDETNIEKTPSWMLLKASSTDKTSSTDACKAGLCLQIQKNPQFLDENHEKAQKKSFILRGYRPEF